MNDISDKVLDFLQEYAPYGYFEGVRIFPTKYSMTQYIVSKEMNKDLCLKADRFIVNKNTSADHFIMSVVCKRHDFNREFISPFEYLRHCVRERFEKNEESKKFSLIFIREITHSSMWFMISTYDVPPQYREQFNLK